MKDVFSAFATEVFRPLVTLALPGGVALTPYFIALMQRLDAIYRIVDANHTEASLILVLIALFAGLIIEDLGVRFESSVLDRGAKAKDESFEVVWWKYMTHEFRGEPPGRNYLRALVIRLKFELGAAIALIVAIPGVFLVQSPSPSVAYWISIAAALLSIYLTFEGCSAHAVLGRLRARLVEEDMHICRENDERAAG